MDEQGKKLNYEEFVKVAVLRLRDISKSKGIHAVFSGFNEAFKKHFGEDPIRVTQELASAGKIETRFVRGGVMIYLPGEGPRKRSEKGDEALAIILGQVSEKDKGLVEKVILEITEAGTKSFPDDFVGDDAEVIKYVEIQLPGTELRLDSHSQSALASPRRHFRYEAKNPSEAKYILYAHKLGIRSLRIPADNRVLFKAVSAYESYCEQIRGQSFSLFVKYTHDEATSELLTRDVEQRLDLRGCKGVSN